MGHPISFANASVATVCVGEDGFAAELARPTQADGLVLLVHAAGGGWHSRRSSLVAALLNEHRLATLQFELHGSVGPDAPADGRVAALGACIVQGLDWTMGQRDLAGLRCGLLGAGRGAAAALAAAAARPMRVAALVTCGGRPDLAAEVLARVSAPAMLIVGGNDPEVLELNRAALRRLTCAKRLELVPRATHHFQEPGALVSAVELAAWWFGQHLAAGRRLGAASAG